MKRLIAISIALSILSAAAATAAEQQPARQAAIKVLFLAAGPIHNHIGLAPILIKDLEATGNFTVSLTEDVNRLASLDKDRPDALIFYTTGLELTPEQETSLTQYVASGGGWVGIHSASDSFKNSDAYWKMVGGRFSGHGQGTFDVHFTVSRHEAVRGLANFSITDEDYNHDFHKEARILVLARRPKDGAPAVWVQHYGQGRVFYTGLGHDQQAWDNPAFKALVIRGTYWAAQRQPVEPETASAPSCCIIP